MFSMQHQRRYETCVLGLLWVPVENDDGTVLMLLLSIGADPVIRVWKVEKQSALFAVLPGPHAHQVAFTALKHNAQAGLIVAGTV